MEYVFHICKIGYFGFTTQIIFLLSNIFISLILIPIINDDLLSNHMIN